MTRGHGPEADAPEADAPVNGDHRTRVAQAYQRSAGAFARAADPLLYRILAEPLVEAVRAVPGGRLGPVLDVAAGAGAFGRAFADVVALDVAAGQLVENPARRRVIGDVESLPFRSDSFAVAGCAFGINHLLDPGCAVVEMARVAPVVAVSTWLRPDRPFAPKRAVEVALERQVGSGRTELGGVLDGIIERIGSVGAVARLFDAAGLDADVIATQVEIPWPGVDSFVDYRVGMPTTPDPTDLDALRDAVARALAGWSTEALTWRPGLIVAVGTRPSRRSGGSQPPGEHTATHETIA